MSIEGPTTEDRRQASPHNIEKMRRFVHTYVKKSGSYLHPDPSITEYLIIGLAKHIEEVGRPLCPCNFYDDIVEEAKSSYWSCPCEEMQKDKYCH